MTDTKPVFDAIVESCQALFEDSAVALRLVRDGALHVEANVGIDSGPVPLDRTSAVGTCVLEARTIHAPDMAAALEAFPRGAQMGVKLGFRSAVFSPLVRDGIGIGTIAIFRRQLGAFSDRDIALLNTFAGQAVIAIENVRLFNETREALERQTATAEVLQVIGSSVADTAPVFDKILDSCQHLFATEQLGIFEVGEAGMIDVAAWRGEALGVVARTFPKPIEESASAQVLREQRILHVPDVAAAIDAPPTVRSVLAQIGNYSIAWAPMLWEGRGIGTLCAMRQPPKPFSDKELALLQTFANQAVIAIQNARLFRETNEALERQTATAEVLQVISSSVADARPVFEKIMDSCKRLIPCDGGAILVVDERQQVAIGAVHGERDGMFTRGYPRPIERTVLGLAFDSRRPLYYPQAQSADGVPELVRRFATKAGLQSLLIAPMIWEGRRIGSISIARAAIAAFSEKDIDLLQSFADQGVIAIQNANMFRQTQEALERQTASAEVLSVIGTSMADATPVFNKILASCDILFKGVFSNIGLVGDDGMVRLIVDTDRLAQMTPDQLAMLGRLQGQFPRPLRDSIHGYVIHKNRVLHYPDVLNGADVPEGLRATAQEFGNFSVLYAPMVWQGRGIGALAVNRFPPAPYSERDINLIEAFAGQAVIAIQNAKLFRQTQEARAAAEAANEAKSAFLATM
ncbi:MAG TPA: GAF domain-containing protein, partial [Burkholderiaceae bacterium]|nr:GAF domain-containing protein [Burkholderiaceae bacterium]